MQTSDVMWIQPAMNVIAGTDRETYNAMDRDNGWHVCVTDGSNDIEWVYDAMGGGQDGIMEYMALLYDVPASMGVTKYAPGDPLDGYTFLNRPDILNSAEQIGVAAEDLLAMVLVHEFRHRTGGDEDAAFATDEAWSLGRHDDAGQKLFKLSKYIQPREAMQDAERFPDGR